jgi:hypothetical protein
VTGDALMCVESGRTQPADERGWKAYLTVDDDEPAEAVVYCPECASLSSGYGVPSPPLRSACERLTSRRW